MKITSKGQVTIPKKFRDRYGLEENVEIEFLEKDQKLYIVKKPTNQSPFDQVVGVLKTKGRTDELINKLRGVDK